jgi:hypothetical protein
VRVKRSRCTRAGSTSRPPDPRLGGLEQSLGSAQPPALDVGLLTAPDLIEQVGIDPRVADTAHLLAAEDVDDSEPVTARLHERGDLVAENSTVAGAVGQQQVHARRLVRREDLGHDRQHRSDAGSPRDHRVPSRSRCGEVGELAHGRQHADRDPGLDSGHQPRRHPPAGDLGDRHLEQAFLAGTCRPSPQRIGLSHALARHLGVEGDVLPRHIVKVCRVARVTHIEADGDGPVRDLLHLGDPQRREPGVPGRLGQQGHHPIQPLGPEVRLAGCRSS